MRLYCYCSFIHELLFLGLQDISQNTQEITQSVLVLESENQSRSQDHVVCSIKLKALIKHSFQSSALSFSPTYQVFTDRDGERGYQKEFKRISSCYVVGVLDSFLSTKWSLKHGQEQLQAQSQKYPKNSMMKNPWQFIWCIDGVKEKQN